MSFLIPLVTVLGAIATLVLLVIGLVSVPWPVLLLLLVAGWMAAQRALASVQAAEVHPVASSFVLDELPQSPATPMALKTTVPDTMPGHHGATPIIDSAVGHDRKGKCLRYRGAVYECPEGIPEQAECCEIEVVGKYRGSPSTVHLRGKVGIEPH